MNKRRILLLNKVDALKEKPKLIAQVAWFQERLAFDNVFMISAKTGDGVADFLRDVASHVPNGPFLYDEDTMTDLPMRLLASEITREQCFFKLREELPYALSVETEQYNMREDGSVEIRQVVIVENERQKMIVIGKGGAMLKKIGQAARFEMKQHLGITAHVFLFVKVREDWKQNPESYRYMGLTAPGSN